MPEIGDPQKGVQPQENGVLEKRGLAEGRDLSSTDSGACNFSSRLGHGGRTWAILGLSFWGGFTGTHRNSLFLFFKDM